MTGRDIWGQRERQGVDDHDRLAKEVSDDPASRGTLFERYACGQVGAPRSRPAQDRAEGSSAQFLRPLRMAQGGGTRSPE